MHWLRFSSSNNRKALSEMANLKKRMKTVKVIVLPHATFFFHQFLPFILVFHVSFSLWFQVANKNKAITAFVEKSLINVSELEKLCNPWQCRRKRRFLGLTREVELQKSISSGTTGRPPRSRSGFPCRGWRSPAPDRCTSAKESFFFVYFSRKLHFEDNTRKKISSMTSRSRQCQ